MISGDEKIKDGGLLSAKQQVRRTVSDNNRQQRLPALNTYQLSQVIADSTSLSPVCTSHMISTMSIACKDYKLVVVDSWELVLGLAIRRWALAVE